MPDDAQRAAGAQSRVAKACEWVEIEWRYALERRGLGFIDPVRLESFRLGAPPSELSEYFYEKWLAFMRTTAGSVW